MYVEIVMGHCFHCFCPYSLEDISLWYDYTVWNRGQNPQSLFHKCILKFSQKWYNAVAGWVNYIDLIVLTWFITSPSKATTRTNPSAIIQWGNRKREFLWEIDTQSIWLIQTSSGQQETGREMGMTCNKGPLPEFYQGCCIYVTCAFTTQLPRCSTSACIFTWVKWGLPAGFLQCSCTERSVLKGRILVVDIACDCGIKKIQTYPWSGKALPQCDL